MRTLISTAFISLDGVVEDPGGQSDYRNGGWTFKSIDFVPEAYAIKGSEQMESTAMLLGRKSYQMFSPVWPKMAEFEHYNALPKYVVSTTLTDDELEAKTGAQPRSCARSTTSARSRSLRAARSSSTAAPTSITRLPTLASSIATTSWCSPSCSARASASSTTATRTRRS